MLCTLSITNYNSFPVFSEEVGLFKKFDDSFLVKSLSLKSKSLSQPITS